MFFVTKFAFVMCTVYLGIAILVDSFIFMCGAADKRYIFCSEGNQCVTRWFSFLRCYVAFGIPDLMVGCDDSSACSN